MVPRRSPLANGHSSSPTPTRTAQGRKSSPMHTSKAPPYVSEGLGDRSGAAQWVENTPVPPNDGVFPEIISQSTGTNWDEGEDDWELRTETVNGVDIHDDSPIAMIQANHVRQITHYKNLLVRAQSASSSSLHELHHKLNALQRAYTKLEHEHAQCLARRQEEETRCNLEKQVMSGLKGGLAGSVRGMGKAERVKLLGMITDACHPSDIDAQIAILEKYRRSRHDLLGRLDEKLAMKVLNMLGVEQVLNLRLVSRRYRFLSTQEALWRTFCRQLEWRDWDGEAGLAHLDDMPESGWEELYKQLWQREKNWNRGLAQHVTLLKGHTNYVTSLRLQGNVLISGSYDETIRIWHIPSLRTSSETTVPSRLVLPAKSVSCLDYYAPAGILVAGSHDVGRVHVWKKKQEGWEVIHTLSGHLHGIRAVAINKQYLVSAGADKALVVWSWQTGEKIVRFGQQTNICIGIQLIHDSIIAVTVDGIIRTFSITKREMLAQYKISDLGKSMPGLNDGMKKRLKDVGAGIGGSGMLTWFEGQGKWMTCATRETIVRLAWDEIEEQQPVILPYAQGTRDPATPSPIKGRIRMTSSTARPLPIASTPIRQRTVSTSTTLSAKKTTPLSKSASLGPASTPSPTGKMNPARSMPMSRTASSSITTRRVLTPTKAATSDDQASPPTGTLPAKSRISPLLSKPPKVLETIHAPDTEKGAVDSRRDRIVTSTRFAARKGADRHLYIGLPNHSHEQSERTKMIPVKGAWVDRAEELNVQTPEKNPMSLVLDRDKFVYGCTDGTIVVVGFDGSE
ncbi:hypothetical protein CI109_100960 [Kwoniella shandongensis]|uniref:Uncharacterized protein n=1 Tax=Kwoniella shandongensis TaxID=1734106 RepID=A0A5M6C4K7_9TREE|nr:uncharacterized protein CI109_001427 [Kwoniella shandongensis]KAA5530024.1 hypothetical protein CI109_001427 [Kwoniella shandongensis]